MKYYSVSGGQVQHVYDDFWHAARSLVELPPSNIGESWLNAKGVYKGVEPSLLKFQTIQPLSVGDPAAIPPVEKAVDMSLDDAKVAAIEESKQIKETKVNAGLVFNIDGTDFYFKTDMESRGYIDAAYFKANQSSFYSVSNWKAGEVSNGQPTGKVKWISPFSNLDIKLVGDVIENHIETAFNEEKTRNDSIGNATTLTELRSIMP